MTEEEYQKRKREIVDASKDEPTILHGIALAVIGLLALVVALSACASHPPGDPWTRYHYTSGGLHG